MKYCKNGHALVDETCYYVRSDGYLRCKACEKEVRKTYKLKLQNLGVSKLTDTSRFHYTLPKQQIALAKNTQKILNLELMKETAMPWEINDIQKQIDILVKTIKD